MMDDTYQFPIFFECHSLLEEQKKKIQNYFCIRRKSSGGECGQLRSVNDKVYSIAFRHQRDQQRVLQKFKHVVELAEGSLVFVVRDDVEHHASTSTSTSSTIIRTFQSQATSSSSPQSPPSGEEYEMKCDTPLLHYFNECPKAWNNLQRELTSVSCSAQIYPEEGRVLVRNLAGASEEEKNWKTEINKIFNGYLCHCEVDPHKVKALLQSCSSDQTTDEVKVYSEDGMAVVVGKRSLVNIRLMDLEGSTVKRQGSRLREKQTSVRRLGEGKLRLLWKDINQSLEREFPGVKVSQGDPGQLVLEGYVKEISGALDCISDKENSILQRTVSDISPHFLTFLKKFYGGPGVLADILGFGDEVEIELKDTELCFFSLSADKLDNAKKVLHDEFKEVKISMTNCSAVLSEFQSKTNELNQGQSRAQILFISDSTVCLLGHKKEVEELSQNVAMLQNVVLDESHVQSTVHLPFPVLAQELPEFLQLHGFDYSGITFHPLTSSYESIVVLEGPSSNVTEVKCRLGPFLDSLVQDEPPTAGYFQNSTQKSKFPNISNSLPKYQYHSSTQHLASLSLSEENTVISSYSLCDGLQVLVCQGDITKQDADVLVNAANEDLDHCGGVAAALSKAGGPEVQKESKVLVKQTGKIPTGDVVVTTGGNLKCKKLLHAVGPVGGEAGGRERFLLEITVRSALNLAEMMEFKSIAMPCISSGLSGGPVTVCSEAIVTAVKEFGSHGGRSLSKIILIDNREEVVRAMQEACDRLLQGISTGNQAPSDLGFQMGAAAQYTGRGTINGAPDGANVEITEESTETKQESLKHEEFTGDVHKPDQVSATKRIVLLGKTGVGKSNLANTICGEELFTTDHSANSGTKVCQTETRLVGERSITLIDTPGLFDTGRSEEEVKFEILRCITECAPGPHAFLIVLKVEKYTQQECTVITKMCDYFSEDALRYAVIVFTHGEQLPKGMKIEEFVRQNKNLSDLVEKCGGRCHVFDNTHWRNKQQNNYRSNQFQVEELLNTIDKMVMYNNGGYYTNKLLQVVEEEIKKEEEHIRLSSGNMSSEEIREQAKTTVLGTFLIGMAGIATGVLLGAFFGVEVMIRSLIAAVKKSEMQPYIVQIAKSCSGEVALAAGVSVGVTTAMAVTGGIIGGVTGHEAAKEAETVQEATLNAYKAVVEKRNATLSHIKSNFSHME